MSYVLSAACGCNTGKRRRNNEDNFYFNGLFLPEQNNGVESNLTYLGDGAEDVVSFAVFDGMGGHASGQTASYLAAYTFAQEMRQDTTNRDSIQQGGYDSSGLSTGSSQTGVSDEGVLRQAVWDMSGNVWQRAEKEYNNMGTTAAILRFTADRCYLANVGDSRIFRYRSGGLKKISHDHTDEEFMRSLGVTDHKPRLTQYVGMPPKDMVVEPYMIRSKVSKGDQYLICSDGLTDMVSEQEIAGILATQASVSEKVDRLIRLALEHGGLDNITVILVQTGDYVKTGNESSMFDSRTEYLTPGQAGQTGPRASVRPAKVLSAVALAAAAMLVCIGVGFYIAGRQHKNTAGRSVEAGTEFTTKEETRNKNEQPTENGKEAATQEEIHNGANPPDGGQPVVIPQPTEAGTEATTQEESREDDGQPSDSGSVISTPGPIQSGEEDTPDNGTEIDTRDDGQDDDGQPSVYGSDESGQDRDQSQNDNDDDDDDDSGNPSSEFGTRSTNEDQRRDGGGRSTDTDGTFNSRGSGRRNTR